MGGGPQLQTPEPGKLDTHDWHVIAFHVGIAAAQGALMALGTYTYVFGPYSSYAAVTIQAIAEFLRRLVY